MENNSAENRESNLTEITDTRNLKREICVSPQEAGTSLLGLLEKRFTYLSRAQWQEHISLGRILFNDKRVESKVILSIGDRITYFPEPRPEPEVNKNWERIYEDENLLLINKPPDLPCHPGGIYLHNTLWGILRRQYQEFYLINRLDRETSGVVTVAKNKKAASYYFWEMKERRIEKEYEVLVEGRFPEHLEARGWLMADKESPVYKKRLFVFDPVAFEGGDQGDKDRQFAITIFFLVQEFPGPISLVRCHPLTGKTHQIRATLQSLGYPVVGDKLYGIDQTIFLRFPTDKMTSNDWIKLRMEHQALHCRRMVMSAMHEGQIEATATRPASWKIIPNYE